MAAGGGGGGDFITRSPISYKKEHLAEQFSIAPFYLISTHGYYSLDRPDWYFEVPANTYIFETQQAGDLCMTTIDEPLFDLLQGTNRNVFNHYFFGTPGDEVPSIAPGDTGGGSYAGKLGRTPSSPDIYRQVLSQLTFYTPGMRIPIRELTIGRVGKDSRITYTGMRFNRFQPGQQSDQYPGTRATEMFGGPIGLHAWFIQDPSHMKTNRDMIELITNRYDKEYTGPRVFFFSSCGAVQAAEGDPRRISRFNEITALQEEARLAAMSANISTIHGSSSMPMRLLTPSPVSGITRSGKQPLGITVSTPYISSGNAMRMQNSTLGPIMRSAMEGEMLASPLICTGYGLYKIEGATILPYKTAEGRICLSEVDLNNAKSSLKYGTFRIDKYGADGRIIDQQTFQIGGSRRHRKTCRRSLRIRRTRRLRIRR